MSKKWTFPPEFDLKVNPKKVSTRAYMLRYLKVALDVIKVWVERRITELMGPDDDVVANFVNALLE